MKRPGAIKNLRAATGLIMHHDADCRVVFEL